MQLARALLSGPLVAVACARAVAVSAQVAEVEVEFGRIRGNTLVQSLEFLGIPFSPKPQRFAAAVPWTDKYPDEGLDATKYSPWCWQVNQFANYSPGAPLVPMSEDCLQLNIFAPLAAGRQSRLPVMVWIHGGGLTQGSAMDPMYNGSSLAAAEGVVVVAMNYRLNVFGFGVAEGKDGPIGANNGFRDQALALRWVQEHISAFGGDAGRVTIFGESAGGQSVGVHVLSPKLSAGLFHRAVAQSGDITNTIPVDTALDITAGYAKALGCAAAGVLACLSQASAESLLATTLGQGPGAVVDGDVLAAELLEIISSGEFNKVPFVLGNNAEEGNLFVDPHLIKLKPVTAESLHLAAAQILPPEAATRLLQLYPPVEGQDNTWMLADMFGDVLFHCDNRRIARALSAAGAAPWAYSWRHSPSCSFVKGAAHGTEITYVFRMPFFSPYHIPGGPTCQVLEDEQQLANRISGLWAQFAREGAMPPMWPRFESPGREETLKLDLGLLEAFDTEMGYSRGTCNVLDSLNLSFADFMAFWTSFRAAPTQQGVVPSSREALPQQILV